MHVRQLLYHFATAPNLPTFSTNKLFWFCAFMYVIIGMNMTWCVCRGQRTTLSVGFYFLLPCVGVSYSLLHVEVWAGPRASRILYLCLVSHTGVCGLQMLSWLYGGSRVLNSGPQACKANVLSTEPSLPLQPSYGSSLGTAIKRGHKYQIQGYRGHHY